MKTKKKVKQLEGSSLTGVAVQLASDPFVCEATES